MVIKIYNPVTKKFVLSKDVKFFEKLYWPDQVDEASNQPFLHHNQQYFMFKKSHTILKLVIFKQ